MIGPRPFLIHMGHVAYRRFVWDERVNIGSLSQNQLKSQMFVHPSQDLYDEDSDKAVGRMAIYGHVATN